MGFLVKLGRAITAFGEDDQANELTKSERQINLLEAADEAKRKSDPEKGKKWLDCVIMRVVWMYAIGDKNFQKKDILEISEMSEKGKPVTRLMYDVLFEEGAKIELRYCPARNAERPDEEITHDEYNALPKSQRSEWHPVVYYRVEGSPRYTVYDGRDDSRDGDIAKRFDECFWELACKFGNYKDITGKKHYTLDPTFSGTSVATCIGVNDGAAYLLVKGDFAAGLLEKMKKEDQLKFLKAVDGAIKHLNECKVAAARYISGDTSSKKDTDKTPTYEKCRLDFLTEEIRKSKNTSFVEGYEKKLENLKEQFENPDSVYEFFVMAELYPDQIAKAEKAYEEYVEGLSEEKKGKSKGDEETDPPKQEYNKDDLPKRTLANWRNLFRDDEDFMALYNAKFFKDLPSNCHILTLIHYIKSNGENLPKAVKNQRKEDIALAVKVGEEKKAKAESDDDGSGDE